jgi:hypothetical protein
MGTIILKGRWEFLRFASKLGRARASTCRVGKHGNHGDPTLFRLGIEAHQLAFAYEYDPYFSLSMDLVVGARTIDRIEGGKLLDRKIFSFENQLRDTGFIQRSKICSN